MKISVIIPAYNASATIVETIESVLNQTHPADEILVMDDGSTDDTFVRLSVFGSRIKVFRQTNQGLSFSRNFLCRQAVGDMVAFLDSDDVWHPDYLKTQHEMLSLHSNAAASFTGLLDSNQFKKNPWNTLKTEPPPAVRVMNSIQFFESYNRLPMRFLPSVCCVLKSLLEQMGGEPFPLKFRRAEDVWFFNVIPLFGKSVIYNPLPRVMYRLSPGSLSEERVLLMDLTVRVCEELSRRYQAEASPELLSSSRERFPSTRRKFAKYLMGAERFSEARIQVVKAIRETRSPKSICKSLFLLAFCCLPKGLQPKWPRQFRENYYQSLNRNAKISVVIPTYNSEVTIRATLDSVLAQMMPADEILVLDDGSTDETRKILETYQSHITILHQENHGVARARNVLCSRATGDLIAFMDHDDLWHPDYLKTQKRLFAEHPEAVVFFAGHTTLYGNGCSQPWNFPVAEDAVTEVIPPAKFIRRYHQAIGIFMSMSFCCVPKVVLQKLGERPFCEEVSGVDDCHLFHQLPLYGSVVYHPELLAVYRVTRAGQSADRLKSLRLSVRALELLWAQYRRLKDAKLRSIFSWAFAMRRREYGKVLMSAGKTGEARRQFILAMGNCLRPVSMAKSVRLLFFSCLPQSIQPRWLPIRTAAQSPDLV